MQLIMTVIGTDQTNLISELTRMVKESKCSILESRLTELGKEFAGHLLVEGNWNHIVKLENAVEALASRHHLKMQTLRSQEDATEDSAVPYAVDIFAADQLDNLHELTSFFITRGIRLMDVSTSRYPAPYTRTPLFSAHLVLRVPAQLRMISLRDEFLDFCDQMNLDAVLEPIKR